VQASEVLLRFLKFVEVSVEAERAPASENCWLSAAWRDMLVYTICAQYRQSKGGYAH